MLWKNLSKHIWRDRLSTPVSWGFPGGSAGWSLQREQIQHLPCKGIPPAWQPGARSPERTVTCLGLHSKTWAEARSKSSLFQNMSLDGRLRGNQDTPGSPIWNICGFRCPESPRPQHTHAFPWWRCPQERLLKDTSIRGGWGQLSRKTGQPLLHS